MCNFSPSAVTGRAILRHSEVVTLFHGRISEPIYHFGPVFSLPQGASHTNNVGILELGHGIHDLLSRTSHTRYHAWRAPAEFSEALSTMLENWCWNKSELKEMSCHYTRVGPDCLQRWRAQHPGTTPPAKQIPEELLDQLIASRNVNKALGLLQQT